MIDGKSPSSWCWIPFILVNHPFLFTNWCTLFRLKDDMSGRSFSHKKKRKNLRFCTVAKSDPPDLKYFDHPEEQRNLGPAYLTLVREVNICWKKVCVIFETRFANDWNVAMEGKLWENCPLQQTFFHGCYLPQTCFRRHLESIHARYLASTRRFHFHLTIYRKTHDLLVTSSGVHLTKLIDPPKRNT